MTIYEAIINWCCGASYYDKHCAPEIIKNSKSFKDRWNKKKACLILSFDIDEDSDIENLTKLLRLLKKYDIKAGFAATGLLAEKHPDIFRAVIKDGHEILNHTLTHPDSQFNEKNFHKMTAKERQKEIKDCHDTIKKLFNYEMKGFRVPHFGYQYTEDIYGMLEKLGYEYSSSTVAIKTKTQGFPFKPDARDARKSDMHTDDMHKDDVWEFPMICCPKHPFCIFDTSHAFRSRFARHDPEEYLESFEKVLDFGIKNNMFLNIYQDPQDIGKFDYEATLKMIVKKKKDLWMPSYKELAKYLDSAGA